MLKNLYEPSKIVLDYKGPGVLTKRGREKNSVKQTQKQNKGSLERGSAVLLASSGSQASGSQ